MVYSQVYAGIDLVYEGSHRLLKYTYYVQPGADPGQIRLTFDGVDGVSVDATTGELVIRTPWGDMRDAAPVAYQDIRGARQNIEVSFDLMGNQGIGFSLGAYDPDEVLIIDPVYSTFLGGGAHDSGYGIAVDGDGNVYVSGFTQGDLPILNAYDSSYNGGEDAIVAKLLIGPLSSLDPVTLSLGNAFGEPGKTVSIPVALTNPNTTSVGGLEWQVIRGSSAIQFDSLITTTPGFIANTNTNGDPPLSCFTAREARSLSRKSFLSAPSAT